MNWRALLLSLLIGITALGISGCSLRSTISIWAIEPVIDGVFVSLMKETDIELAKSAMESDLKLLDGLLETDADNRKLQSLSIQGYAGYAMLFVEDADPERAAELYGRSVTRGLDLLAQENSAFSDSNLSYDEFEEAVKNLPKVSLPVAYWTAFAWFARINLDRSSVVAITEIPRAKLMMEWVYAIDPDFYFHGPRVFFATYYSTFPPLMGGNLSRAKELFQHVFDSEPDFLYAKYLYARYYCTQTLDQEQFEKTIREILEYRLDKDLPYNLLNAVAKRKSQQLKENVEELF